MKKPSPGSLAKTKLILEAISSAAEACHEAITKFIHKDRPAAKVAVERALAELEEAKKSL